MRKENKLYTWGVIVIAFLLLISCVKKNNFIGRLTPKAPGDSTVFIDTTFTIDFEAQVSKISGFGCHVVYDSTQIQYLDCQKYGVFDHESIALLNNKQGRLIIGFNQFDCTDAIEDTLITVFSVTFHVKLTASEGISPVRFENKNVVLCSSTVPSKWYGLNLWLKKLNEFVMRMKLRTT